VSRRPEPVPRPLAAKGASAGALLAVLALVLGLAVAACSSTPSADPGPVGPGGPSLSTASSPNPPSGGSATWGSTVAGRAVLDGFEQVTVRVRQPDGTERTYCLLLAKSEVQRQRGLMQVSDASLGGHDGMLFVFDHDAKGGFWMKDTLLPLSIAYVAADGSVVSTTDMAPCASTDGDCTVYPPGGAYRYAVEVPEGRLDELGLDRAGARLTVGAESCDR
jgi:uncharacterized membrane protein (UPF0127 family)